LEKAPDVIFEEIEKAYKNKDRVKKWVTVADRYLKSYGNGRFERHWTAEDIVNEVITKILEGVRNIEPSELHKLDKYICLDIRSVIDGKFRSRKIVLPPKRKIANKEGEKEIDLIENNYTTEKDYIQYGLERKENLEKCYKELMNDEDAALVFLEWKEGKKSQEIADSLGIPVIEVGKIKKRIRYNLKKELSNN